MQEITIQQELRPNGDVKQKPMVFDHGAGHADAEQGNPLVACVFGSGLAEEQGRAQEGTDTVAISMPR